MLVVSIYTSSSAKPGSFTLTCPGLSTFSLPDLKRKQLPKGLNRPAFRRSAVVGVRITVHGKHVESTRDLPHIAGAGLQLAAAQQ